MIYLNLLYFLQLKIQDQICCFRFVFNSNEQMQISSEKISCSVSLLSSYKNICTLWVKIARLYVLFVDVQLGMNVFKYLNLSAHSVASWQGMLNWRNWAWLWWPEEFWLVRNWTQVEMHVTEMLEEPRWGTVSCLKYSMYLKICLKHFLPIPHHFTIYRVFHDFRA